MKVRVTIIADIDTGVDMNDIPEVTDYYVESTLKRAWTDDNSYIEKVEVIER